MNADLTRVVHGAQSIEMKRPIPVGEPLISSGRVMEVLDKGKGAVINIRTETKTESDELVFTTDWSIFCRGQGDFGGERGSSPFCPSQLRTVLNGTAAFRRAANKRFSIDCLVT